MPVHSPNLTIRVPKARQHMRHDLLQVRRDLDAQRNADACQANQASVARIVILRRGGRLQERAELLHEQVDARSITANEGFAHLSAR